MSQDTGAFQVFDLPKTLPAWGGGATLDMAKSIFDLDWKP